MKAKSTILFFVWICVLIISAQVCDIDVLLVNENVVADNAESLIADEGVSDFDCQFTFINELSENADSEALIPKRKLLTFNLPSVSKCIFFEQKGNLSSWSISHFYTNLPPPII